MQETPILWDIRDRVQCFGVYIAIISHHKPKRVPDLLGYQRIIMETSVDCHEWKWLIWCFCLKASTSNTTQWSTIDITAWNTTFPERAIQSHPPGTPLYQSSQNPLQKSICQTQSLPAWQPICLNWNDNSMGCSWATCHYANLCYRCVHNLRATDRNHKASLCTYTHY